MLHLAVKNKRLNTIIQLFKFDYNGFNIEILNNEKKKAVEMVPDKTIDEIEDDYEKEKTKKKYEILFSEYDDNKKNYKSFRQVLFIFLIVANLHFFI